MINVAIIGASGYTGLELLKILIPHSQFNITYIATSKGGESLTKMHPSLNSIYEQTIEKADALEISKVADLAFLALPHKASMEFAKTPT